MKGHLRLQAAWLPSQDPAPDFSEAAHTPKSRKLSCRLPLVQVAMRVLLTRLEVTALGSPWHKQTQRRRKAKVSMLMHFQGARELHLCLGSPSLEVKPGTVNEELSFPMGDA